MKQELDETKSAKEKVEKQLKTEKVLKQQAVNKLAEVMNRKDMSKDNKKNKVLRNVRNVEKGVMIEGLVNLFVIVCNATKCSIMSI